MSDYLLNKVVIITGSSRGIGKELAVQVLSAGGKVVINSRSETTLQSLAKELSKQFDEQNILVCAGDISQKENARQLITSTIDTFGSIHILINNAGLVNYGFVGAFEPDTAQQIIDVNIYGVMYPTWYALPHIRETRGSIQIVSSLAAIHGLPEYAPYSMSKMALTAFGESLKIELAGSGVHIGIAYVGFTSNESAKKILNPLGEYEEMPARLGVRITPRQITAAKILKQIERRKFKDVHSLLGKMNYLVNRMNSGIVDYILTKRQGKLK